MKEEEEEGDSGKEEGKEKGKKGVWDFPGGLVVNTMLLLQGAWV